MSVHREGLSHPDKNNGEQGNLVCMWPTKKLRKYGLCIAIGKLGGSAALPSGLAHAIRGVVDHAEAGGVRACVCDMYVCGMYVCTCMYDYVYVCLHLCLCVCAFLCARVHQDLSSSKTPPL